MMCYNKLRLNPASRHLWRRLSHFVRIHSHLSEGMEGRQTRICTGSSAYRCMKRAAQGLSMQGCHSDLGWGDSRGVIQA